VDTSTVVRTSIMSGMTWLFFLSTWRTQ